MMTEEPISDQQIQVATWSELEDRKPIYALVANVDLVIIRFDEFPYFTGVVSTAAR